ncbi:MAG: outer membrane beta-barrel protein [Bythopirellula sp.]|nr:outer membrane beta-barrel protein [Bythopirellula sp.]
MKLKTWTAGIAALVLSAAPVFAVEGNVQWSDSLVTPASCDDSCCDPGCECGDPCDCGCGVGAAGLFSGIGGGCVENFTLAGLLGLDDSCLEVGGWTQMGYHDKFEPLSNEATGRGTAFAFNDVPDELRAQQQWFYMGKTADGSNGFDWGFRGDFIYGTDAQKTQAFGNPGAGVVGQGTFDASFDHGIYGWAIPQAYGEVAINDMAIKVGHFFTPLGYEVIPATGNFFYSHALTMFNSEPFTHTGVLSTYTGFEGMTLYNGWTLGWDTGFDNLNSGNNYLGGFGVDLMDSVTFTYLCTYGNFGLKDGGGDDSYSHAIVLNAGLTDKLTYIAQTDYLSTDEQNDSGIPRTDNVGLNQYLIYQYNDILGLGTRMEWWKGAGPAGGPFATRASRYEVTSGVNIKLLGNLVMRPEFRYDWCPAEDFDQDMGACDFILTY